MAFAGDIAADFPMTRGKDRILSLLKFLENLPRRAKSPTWPGSSRGSSTASQRRGLVVVVSDLYDPAGFQSGLDLLRHHRYEPHVIQIFDKKEADPNLLGDLELFDVETESIQKVTVTERNLRQYRAIFDRFQESIQTYCNAYGLGCTRTSTESRSTS